MSDVSPTVLPGMKIKLRDWDGTVVKFNVHAASRKISARWKNGMVEVVVPPGMSTRTAVEAVLSMRERLEKRKPKVLFSEGQTLQLDGIRFRFGRQSLSPLSVHMTGAYDDPVIAVGTGLSYDDDEVTAIISRLMMRAAYTVAPAVLLPMARAEAERLGLKPAKWSISRGHRVLGHCSGRGEIALSSRCVFLPEDLRRYIICHELAHLTEMNHSVSFHSLCDSYLDGNEKELIKKLKTYQWPLL